MCARVIYAMPLALDAVAVVGARRGQVWFVFISFQILERPPLLSCPFVMDVAKSDKLLKRF